MAAAGFAAAAGLAAGLWSFTVPDGPDDEGQLESFLLRVRTKLRVGRSIAIAACIRWEIESRDESTEARHLENTGLS